MELGRNGSTADDGFGIGRFRYRRILRYVAIAARFSRAEFEKGETEEGEEEAQEAQEQAPPRKEGQDGENRKG